MAACDAGSSAELVFATATTKHATKNAVVTRGVRARRSVTPRAYRFLRPRAESCRWLLVEAPEPAERGRDEELRPAAGR